MMDFNTRCEPSLRKTYDDSILHDDHVDIGGCEFWLGKELVHRPKCFCGTDLFMKSVDAYIGTEPDENNKTVARFIRFLLMKSTKHSFQGFMDQVDAFSCYHKLDSKDVLKLVHDSYEEERAFVHFIGADRLLWFLTHSWDNMSGPSFAVQHCKIERSGDALRMFMDVPCYAEDRSHTEIDEWSSTELIFGREFHSLLPNGFLPQGLQTLVLHCECAVDSLPPGLIELTAETLILGKTAFPMNLKTLSLNEFDELRILPRGLHTLQLKKFDRPLREKELPNSLVKLTLGQFNWPLETNVFPDGLEYLDLTEFDQPLQTKVFP